MGLFTAKVAGTPQAVAEKAMTAIHDSNSSLALRKNAALSVFRSTAVELHAINDELQENVRMANEVLTYFAAEKENISKEINDNDAVARRILEIIGE